MLGFLPSLYTPIGWTLYSGFCVVMLLVFTFLLMLAASDHADLAQQTPREAFAARVILWGAYAAGVVTVLFTVGVVIVSVLLFTGQLHHF